MNYEKGASQKYVICFSYSHERVLVHGELSQIHDFCLWCWFGHGLKSLYYGAFLTVLSEEITVLCSSSWLQVYQYCFQRPMSSSWQIWRLFFLLFYWNICEWHYLYYSIIELYFWFIFFFPQNFCVRGLELFSSYLFKDILELYDWNLKGNFYLGKTKIYKTPTDCSFCK